MNKNTASFISWAGGLEPVDRGTMVEVILRDGRTDTAKVENFVWDHNVGRYDIMFYRKVEPGPLIVLTEEAPLPAKWAVYIEDGEAPWEEFDVEAFAISTAELYAREHAGHKVYVARITYAITTVPKPVIAPYVSS